jgi:uncharacterized protein (TIGR00730 family)
MRVVEGMSERKQLIFNLSDAFIAMPGGFGTMDEIFEMLTQFQLGISDKPCGLLNVNGFYDPLVQQLDRFVAERFLRLEHREHVLMHASGEELLRMLNEETQKVSRDQQWIETLKQTNRY